MRKWTILRHLAIVPVLIALAGCSGYKTQEISNTTAKGDAFTTTLVAEYKRAALYEANSEAEWEHADWFASKGLDAAAGKDVGPVDYVSAGWKVPANAKVFVEQWYKGLTYALANGGKTQFPQDCAKAQVKWDEWLEELNEGDKGTKEQAELVPLLEKCTIKAAAAPAPVPAAAPAPTPAPAPAKDFIVYFDFDKSAITSKAATTIAEIARAAGSARTVVLGGHADQSGEAGYNQKLSERRVEAVKQALVAAGVPAGHITSADAYGDTKPRIPVQKGTKEAENRRVEVHVQ